MSRLSSVARALRGTRKLKKGVLLSIVLIGIMLTFQSAFASKTVEDNDCESCKENQVQKMVEDNLCPEIPPLGQTVEMCWTSGTNSYFKITIKWDSDNDGEIDCMKTYDGWCADSHIYIDDPYDTEDDDHCFPVTLYSSLDPNLPTIAPYACDDERWNCINYVFTQWFAGKYLYEGASWKDIQQVVWMLADDNYSPNKHVPPWGVTPKVTTMYSDALKYGADFVPDVGDLIALICDYGDFKCNDCAPGDEGYNDPDGINDKQLVFILVTYVPGIPVPEVPFGTIAVIAAFFVALLFVRLRARNNIVT